MTAAMNIVVLDGTPLNPGDVSWAPIERLGRLTVYNNTSLDQITTRARNADIVLVNKVPLSASAIPVLSACRLVGVLATGANNLDLSALTAAGIQACNVPNYGPDDVAQHALALLLELARGTALHSQSVKTGDWNKNGWCYWLKPPVCLTGLTIGIIGFGAIGQKMGGYTSNLGMNVMAWSRNHNAKTAYPFKYAELPQIFAEADVISLHCPLTPQTEKLINKDSIASMKNGVLLVNTARGGLVEEAAVAEALINGKLAGFGADVLCSEPPNPGNPLLSAPNTLITPHMAWATANARQNIINIMADNIKAFMEGNIKNAINLPAK